MITADHNYFEQNFLAAAIEIETSTVQLASQPGIVAIFLEEFNRAIAAIRSVKPGASFNGKQAILAVEIGNRLNRVATREFLQSVVILAEVLVVKGALARVAIEFSQGCVVPFAPINGCPDQGIPLGPAVDLATELLAHSQAGEVICSDSARGLVDEAGLLADFPLFRNDAFFTRRGTAAYTHSFDPTGSKMSSLYNPHVPSHSYRRFTSLPSIESSTLQSFIGNGLEQELRRVVSGAYDAIIQVTKGETFFTSSDVLDVLTRVNYDPSDRVLVISRNDRPTGFWNQGRKKQYIKFLKENGQLWSGRINQVRVWVFDETLEDDLMPRTSIFNELAPMHSPKTLFSVSAGLLQNYSILSGLIFGVTVSTKHRYAIISVPSTVQIDSASIETDEISELLWRNRDYSDLDGPMKAIITADEQFVSNLIDEFDSLLQDETAVCLR
jgi:hypothetical protein